MKSEVEENIVKELEKEEKENDLAVQVLDERIEDLTSKLLGPSK